MGVPGFFSWLIRKYKNIRIDINSICNVNPINDNYWLYLDSNSIFHPCCQEILEKNKYCTDVNNIECMMIDNILKTFERIFKIVPVKNIYIAVDGVPPISKIRQQRFRRFMHESNNDIWSSIVITPGTIFMDKLHNSIITFIDEYRKCNDVNILYSSVYENGEGEQKIFNHIRNDNIINALIFGLDADLIFISILNHCDRNIFLMRDEHLVVSMNIAIDCIKLLMPNVEDFVLLCYLIGNDFIPNIACVTPYEIDHIINIYNKCQKKIVINGVIDKDTLRYFLKMLAKSEKYFFNKIIEKKIIPDHKLNYNIYKKYWIYDYYHYYTGVVYDLNDVILNMCSEYIYGICWIYDYYKCGIYNDWQYSYLCAPLLFHLQNDHNILYQQIHKCIDITIDEHILSVLPKKFRCIMNKKILDHIEKYDSLIIDYQFPTHFKLDTFFKSKSFKYIPMIPNVDMANIKQYLCNK